MSDRFVLPTAGVKNALFCSATGQSLAAFDVCAEHLRPFTGILAAPPLFLSYPSVSGGG